MEATNGNDATDGHATDGSNRKNPDNATEADDDGYNDRYNRRIQDLTDTRHFENTTTMDRR
jgi:hypothetical protein